MEAELTTGEKRARGVALCRGEAERWRREAERWRREAGNVRDHATLPHLNPAARATLLRSADRCDDEAAYWESGTRGYET